MKHKKLSLDKPIIYLITKGNTTQQNFSEKSIEILDLIKVAVENEISLIQIREKNLTANLIYKLTTKSIEIAKNSKTKILVNDRADIAFAAKADGVHLTSDSLSAKSIRKYFPPDFIIGVSAHTLAEVKTVQREGADFATFSPIFYSPNKGKPKGLNELKYVSERIQNFPVIGLGGIDGTNYKTVLDAGAAGFAAIRFLNNPQNLRNLKREIL